MLTWKIVGASKASVLYIFNLNIMLTWKIVGVSKASILYIYIDYALVEPHQRPYYLLISNHFSLIFFDSFYLFINFVVYDYIFSNFSPFLLSFYLLSTININITLALSFYFPFILTSLISSSNYKFANLFHSIHILSHKKVITLFLSCVFLSFYFWQF